jgi:hypothetical protein
MPDPISSSYVSPDLTCNGEPELSCDPPVTPPLPAGSDASLPPPTEAGDGYPSAASSAASGLAIEYLRTDHSKLIAASTAPPQPADTAQAWFASAHGPGPQFQPEIGASRTTYHGSFDGVHLSGTIDTMTAGLHAGALNDDGSRGANLGASATLVSGEVTAEYKGYSFTFGESLSLGASVSVGDGRDIDADGVRERCFKGSLGPLTLGVCDEL